MSDCPPGCRVNFNIFQCLLVKHFTYDAHDLLHYEYLLLLELLLLLLILQLLLLEQLLLLLILQLLLVH